MSIPVSDSDVNPATTLDAALEYIRNGWAVLPLNPRDKRPVGKLVPQGVKDASKDERRIRDWFGRTDTNYNIGIALGDVSGGLVVIDYDSQESTGTLIQPERPAYWDSIVRTGTGYHCYAYYRGVDALRTYNHEHGEVRWNGSYVVAPPSIHPNGRRYEWITWSKSLSSIDMGDLPKSVGTASEPLPTDFSQKPNTERIEHALATIPIWSYRYLSDEFFRANTDRSSSEWGLVHTLVDNGLSDSDILYVFQSYLSTESHYADHRYPLKYLSHTLGKVRAEKEQSHASTRSQEYRIITPESRYPNGSVQDTLRRPTGYESDGGTLDRDSVGMRSNVTGHQGTDDGPQYNGIGHGSIGTRTDNSTFHDAPTGNINGDSSTTSISDINAGGTNGTKTNSQIIVPSGIHPVLQPTPRTTTSGITESGIDSTYTNGTAIGIEQLVSTVRGAGQDTTLGGTGPVLATIPTDDESDTDFHSSSLRPDTSRTTTEGMATIQSERPDSDGTGTTDVPRREQSSSTTTSGWVIRTLSDAYRPRPPLKYVVAGLFAEASLNIVYGPPGSLKSMLLTDMMGAVVAGDTWLKHTLGEEGGFETIQTPALWIDYDNGVRRSDEHFEATGRWYGLPENAPLFYMSMATPWLNPKDDRTMELLKQFILSYNIGLVIGDNLGLLSGGADENSAEMIPVMGAYRKLAEDTGACVVLVHHQSKNSQSSRRGNSLRGFSGIEGALDLALNIEREDPTTGYVEAHPTKVRGNTIEPFGATFDFTHRKGTKDLYRAGFYGIEIKNDKSDNSLRDAVIAYLDGGVAYSQTDLVAHVKSLMEGVGVNRIRSQIKMMVEQREVIETNAGNKNTKYYSLPQGE